MAAQSFSSVTPATLSDYHLTHVTEVHPGLQEGTSLTTGKIKKPHLWQALKSVRVTTLFYSSLVAVLGSLSFGYALGFSSPALADLADNKGKHTSFNKTIYSDTFNALTAVGGLVGAPLAGWLVDHSGRQFTMVFCSLPFTIGWILMLITHDITGLLYKPLLFIGRFIVGIGIGGTSLVVPLYIAEISPSELRGLFGALNQLAVTVGILLVQAIAIGLRFEWLCVIALAILLVYVPLSAMTLKESPRWLISFGRNMMAGKVLAWLRGPDFDVSREQTEIETQLSREEKLTLLEQLRSFSSRSAYHPLILAMFLMFFQQFSGINGIILNGESIFKQAGVSNPALVTAISIGAVQVLATLVGVILTDIVGRKFLLTVGGIAMCLSLAVLSVYDFLKNEPYCHPDAVPADPKCKDNLQPLAIAAVMVYIVGFSIGWGALPWLLTSEIIPSRVKGAGVGIATCFNWICATIVLLSFLTYQDTVQPWGAFLTFAIICFFSVIFVLVFVPETKGKSLEMIESHFNHTGKQYTPL